MDVIELHDDAGCPSDYRSGIPMYSNIPESLAAALFPPSDLPISAFIEFIDLSAEGLLVVLAEASPGDTQTGKGKAKAEEIEGDDSVDNEWP
ncbi:hypothetical protein BDR03DRAFT_1018202 [Suillus americanus]|nr:hypothetical protein BDR03DRAFT_1018202 [Suillus americanus]